MISIHFQMLAFIFILDQIYGYPKLYQKYILLELNLEKIRVKMELVIQSLDLPNIRKKE